MVSFLGPAQGRAMFRVQALWAISHTEGIRFSFFQAFTSLYLACLTAMEMVPKKWENPSKICSATATEEPEINGTTAIVL